jgi:hypothetical protein
MVEVRRRASMGSTACSGAPVRRGQGHDAYMGDGLLTRPRPSRQHGAQGLGLRARQGGTPRRPAVRWPPAQSVRRGARPAHGARGEDFKGPLGHAAPWEGARPRSTRGPEVEGGGRPWYGMRGAPARRRGGAPKFWRCSFRLDHFEHVFLPIFEQKCTKR